VNLHETATPPSTVPRGTDFAPAPAVASLLPVVSGPAGTHLSLRQNIRELPSTAWVLIAGAFVNRFASFAVFYLVLFLTREGFSPTRAGLVVAVWGTGEVLASLVGGHLADRLGRRTTIAASMFASAAAVVAVAEVHAYGVLVPIAFLAGLATEMYRPAGGALVADVVPEAQRVTAFALLRFAVNLAIAGGAVVAAFLVSHSFVWVFYTDAATSVAFGVLALVALPQGARVRRSEETGHEGYRAALRDRAFAIFLASSILAAFVYFQQQAALPLHVRASGLADRDFGLLLALNGLLIVLFELPLSSWSMRRSRRSMVSLGFALVGVGFGLTAFAHSLTALFATVSVWTLGEMIGAPVGYAYVADIAPVTMRGRYQGLYGLCWSSGTVTAPAIGAYLVARAPSAFWMLCGVLGVASAALALAAGPAVSSRIRQVADRAPSGPGPEV
jgi:MFS family permease